MTTIDPTYKCPICHEIETPKERFVLLEGPKHACITNQFHKQCAERWFVSSALSVCPVCMVSVTHVNGILIFIDHGSILVKGAENNNLSRVEEAIQRGGIAPQFYRTAMSLAVLNGNADIVQALLPHMSVSESERGQWVISATNWGYIDILNVLLANGPIAEASRAFAIIWAATSGFTLIVNALLTRGAISETCWDKILTGAASSGDIDGLKAVLKYGSISESGRSTALTEAEANGYAQIVTLLSTTRTHFIQRIAIAALAAAVTVLAYWNLDRVFSS